jgi:hypothetical protein
VALLRPELLLALLGLLAPVRQTTPPPTAEQVKAVFLFNFTQFVEWPAQALGGPDAPLVIGILGDDPFGRYLDETVRGELVRGRAIVVRRFRSLRDMGTSHVLYVSRSEYAELPAILAALRGRAILTVGEGPAFTAGGGVIAFTLERSRIRMRINPAAADAARLTLSSRLLQVAQTVGGTQP